MCEETFFSLDSTFIQKKSSNFLDTNFPPLLDHNVLIFMPVSFSTKALNLSNTSPFGLQGEHEIFFKSLMKVTKLQTLILSSSRKDVL
jgi:hypothetical protein